MYWMTYMEKKTAPGCLFETYTWTRTLFYNFMHGKYQSFDFLFPSWQERKISKQIFCSYKKNTPVTSWYTPLWNKWHPTVCCKITLFFMLYYDHLERWLSSFPPRSGKKKFLPSFKNRAFFFFLRSTQNFLLSRLTEIIYQLLLTFLSIHWV